MNSNSIPLATYRLQFNKEFNFKQATEIVDYLSQLGISHCYASPILTAKPGSMHGYDIVDYSRLNPEIGTPEEFENLVNALHSHKMEILIDIVPNHMHIINSNNQWWQDILENGPSSPYADYFDIDWHPPRAIHANKVLLPILDQQYGKALEQQVLKVIYQKGSFFIKIYQFTLPTDPKSWTFIIEPLSKEVEKIFPQAHEHYLELKSLVTALGHLPPTTEQDKDRIAERFREKEMIKKRLENLFNTNPTISHLLSQQLEIFNGKKGDPLSFDVLESFLGLQPYRLSFWRVANDEINYRRFFDIFDYAGIRMEKLEVFEAAHALIVSLIQKGWVKGLRIDHIDGLWDPEQYLSDLQKYFAQNGEPYVLVEKILIGNEKLRPEWKTQGTVGYDFLNQLNQILVYMNHKNTFLNIYQNFTGLADYPSELVYICKRLVLDVLLSSELHVLARRLDSIAESHRSSQDFTAESLKAALSDVIACFPVYRSYLRAQIGQIHQEDRQYILTAIAGAKRRNPVREKSIFDFIQNVLLLEYPEGLQEGQKIERQNFVMRFQQLTGPIMAKGLEDTAYYRFYPLSSLEEVGSDLHTFGISIESFHKKNLEKFESFPHALLASTTHDTKRSEDVRARINLLSEMPQQWEEVLHRWSKMNECYKIEDIEEIIPNRNEEYLIYQTLIGTWPLEDMSLEAHRIYISRIQKYMEKAVKEAKVYSSWIKPNEHHDQGVQQFIEKILSLQDTNPFLKDLKAFVAKISFLGLLNSLSQVILKLSVPGVPDIYQGNEIWDFSLVDPDNRRPVDYSLRKQLLESLQSSSLQDYLQNPHDGRIKLFITQKTLRLRQKLSNVFNEGIYLPLNVNGKMQNHVIAYARVLDKQAIIVLVGRFFSFFMKDFQNYLQKDTWHHTFVEIPTEFAKRQFKNVYTEENFFSSDKIHLPDVFGILPFTVLELEG